MSGWTGQIVATGLTVTTDADQDVALQSSQGDCAAVIGSDSMSRLELHTSQPSHSYSLQSPHAGIFEIKRAGHTALAVRASLSFLPGIVSQASAVGVMHDNVAHTCASSTLELCILHSVPM